MARSAPPEAVVVSGPITPFGGPGPWGWGWAMGVAAQDRKASDKGDRPYDSSYRACLTGLFNGHCRSRSESV